MRFQFQVGNQINKGRIPWNKGKTGVQVAWNKGKKISEDICRICHVELNDSNWYPSQKKLNRHTCKKCETERSIKYYKAHKIEVLSKNRRRSREWYNLHREKAIKSSKESYIRNRPQKLLYLREYYKAHRNSPITKESAKARSKKYNHSLKARLKSQRYSRTPKGKITNSKKHSKRNRNLDFVALNNWFIGSHGHHINRVYVIYIPKDIHTSIWHELENKELMKKINERVLVWAIDSNMGTNILEIINSVVSA